MWPSQPLLQQHVHKENSCNVSIGLGSLGQSTRVSGPRTDPACSLHRLGSACSLSFVRFCFVLHSSLPANFNGFAAHLKHGHCCLHSCLQNAPATRPCLGMCLMGRLCGGLQLRYCARGGRLALLIICMLVTGLVQPSLPQSG